MTTVHKYTVESRFVNFQFAGALPVGVTIGSPSASSSPSGLTLGTPAIVGTVAQVLVSGGTDKSSYILTMQVTCSDSEILAAKALIVLDDEN